MAYTNIGGSSNINQLHIRTLPKISDLEDHKHGKKVVIQGKTGARRIPLISSVPHLQAWLNNHPQADERDAPLWVNIGTVSPGKKAEYRSIRKMLDEVAERAGVDKPVNPHHFRHSRATYLASRFTESQLCEWFGWVQGSDRPADYVHLSGRDIDADYARIHGIQDQQNPEESQLAPNDCPRCDAKNAPSAKFCQNCGQALTTEAYEEIEEGKKWIETLENQEVEAEGSLDSILERMVEKKIKQMK